MGKPKSQGSATPKPIETNEREREKAFGKLIEETRFERYIYDDTFRPAQDVKHFGSVHTMNELAAHLELNEKTEIEARILEANSEGVYRYRLIKDRKQFLEAWNGNKRIKKLREADVFAQDIESSSANAGLVGDDYIPLMGGPFNKQPYLYDYLRAHAYCFHEYHHHPFARAIVHITRDFVLGRGFRVDSEDVKALALWRAFEEANGLQEMAEYLVKEGSAYGENMIWWLPNQASHIDYKVQPGQESERVTIPRIRMIDPSTVWEIVTYPEDITRVISYNQVFPTQYQIYTGKDAGKPVPTAKFIVQQIPAKEMMHIKYNCASNEKRGRSDLFPVLGYLKWIRDCVNYKLIALKKQSAWSEDIIVEGSQVDVDALADAFKGMGTFEPAGSRFIHTDKIKREYLASPHSGASNDETLTWGINMIAAGTQIPVTYFGLSHSAGQSRASAIVGTEPVAKKFEQRQKEFGRLVKALWRRFQDEHGVKGSDCEVTFPEIITQDRSAKLKDIKLAEDSGYISRERAATLASKEFDIDDYDYDIEKETIKNEEAPPVMPTMITPLTSPAQVSPQGAAPAAPSTPKLGLGAADTSIPSSKPSAVTSKDRRDVTQRKGF